MKTTLLSLLLISLHMMCAETIPSNFDIRNDILRNDNDHYEFNELILPKKGENEEEIYKRVGIPSLRYTFQNMQEVKFNNEVIAFNRLVYYISGKSKKIQGNGYSGFETVETLHLVVFLKYGHVERISIKHLVRDPPIQQQFTFGKYDSKDTKVLYPIIEDFPDSQRINANYWSESGEFPDQNEMQKLTPNLNDPRWLQVVEEAKKYRDIPPGDYDNILHKRIQIFRYPVKEKWYKFGKLD